MSDRFRHVPRDSLPAQTHALRDLLVAKPIDTMSKKNVAGLGMKTHQRSLDSIDHVAGFECRQKIRSGHPGILDWKSVGTRALIGRLRAVLEDIAGNAGEIGLGTFNVLIAPRISIGQARKTLLHEVISVLAIGTMVEEAKQPGGLAAIEIGEKQLLDRRLRVARRNGIGFGKSRRKRREELSEQRHTSHRYAVPVAVLRPLTNSLICNIDIGLPQIMRRCRPKPGVENTPEEAVRRCL